MSYDACGDDSSFNDDAIPDSELDFMSSDFFESDVEGYVAPITRTKEHLTGRLMKYGAQGPIDDEFDSTATRMHRARILNEYKNYILKKRAIKALSRYNRIKEMNLNCPHQDAYYLEKVEIYDKKLNKPYYYEMNEPNSYKRLLNKRLRAIKRKFEMYRLDEDYRKDFEFLIRSRAFGLEETLDEIVPFYDLQTTLDSFESDDDDEDECHRFDDGGSADADADEEQSDASSMYDNEVPLSEVEYFSSDFEDDSELPYPPPLSRRMDRFKYYMAKCLTLEVDKPHTIEKKKIRKAEVEAQFKNFKESQRYFKALSRFKTVQDMHLDDPEEEADKFIEMEIYDKKLHRTYYYDEDEPEIYKQLLIKRRNAIVRKYQRYAYDKEFRETFEHELYVNVLRTQRSPLFEKVADGEYADDEPERMCEIVDSVSSFNDSEIPTSEEEFLSDTSLCIPLNYDKPPTRTKEALYKEFEAYEIEADDSPSLQNMKRKLRLEIITQFKQRMASRRKTHAWLRFYTAGMLGTDDPGLKANKLYNMELEDKKLNRPFYYEPNEPEVFRQLKNKRMRAIRRKYDCFVNNAEFREQMQDRAMESGNHTLQEDSSIEE